MIFCIFGLTKLVIIFSLGKIPNNDNVSLLYQFY